MRQRHHCCKDHEQQIAGCRGDNKNDSQKCASCYVRVKSHLVRSDPTQVKCVSVQEPCMWGPESLAFRLRASMLAGVLHSS